MDLRCTLLPSGPSSGESQRVESTLGDDLVQPPAYKQAWAESGNSLKRSLRRESL
jgi:hypothetical protein